MKSHSRIITHPSGRIARMNTTYDEVRKTAIGVLFPLGVVHIGDDHAMQTL